MVEKKPGKKIIYLFIGICIPFLYLLSPSWLAISGVGPSWSLLWLLPWSIKEGPLSGMFAALCLGLTIDSIVLDGATQIPSLILLGFWWGKLGIRGPLLAKSFNIGLLAFLGCLISGISILIQNVIWLQNDSTILLNASIFHTLLAQSIITGLMAPMACSVALLTFFRNKAS